jgi:hypothetical protein
VLGAEPDPGVVMTAVADLSQIRDVCRMMDEIQHWLSAATNDLENAFLKSKTAPPDRPSREPNEERTIGEGTRFLADFDNKQSYPSDRPFSDPGKFRSTAMLDAVPVEAHRSRTSRWTVSHQPRLHSLSGNGSLGYEYR